MVRDSMGLDTDPIRAYRESGYYHQILMNRRLR
jgi:L-rhamnose isomerase